MDPETAITETSVVDLANVHAIRRGKRGMERIPIFRTDRVDKAAFVNYTHFGNHLDAAEDSTRSLLPEADRMSLFRQNPNPETKKRAYSNQLSAATEEEIRLLGGSGRHDPEAVSIAKPVTRHSGMFGKIIPGGPQPRNTLSRAPFATPPTVNRKAASNLNPRGGTQQALAVEVHRGTNVKSTSNTSERDEAPPPSPSAKRRKLDQQPSPASSDQTDPLDQLSPHEVFFHTSQGTSQPPGRATSASPVNRASGVPMKRDYSSEFRQVERMMDSRPKSKKQRLSENRRYKADHGLLPSSPKHSPTSVPIDVSGDESQVSSTNPSVARRTMERGIARQSTPTVNGTKANTSKPLKERASLTQSPFFNRPGLPAPRSKGNVKQKLVSQSLDREVSPGLAQKFVAADGTRRGSDVNASSDADELQSVPTTVGQNAVDPDVVFTVKDLRSSSPSKHRSVSLKATSPTDDLAIWAPSTIKSDFASSNAKSRSSGRPSRPGTLDQEAKPPWSIALAAISLPGRLYKDEDLGLVYDHKQGEYYTQLRGSRVQTTHSSLRIQPQKLIKILWENTGVRIRLESSRSGIEDNVLDLEVASERDVPELLRRLQCSKPLSVIGRTSEYMQKIFEKRRSELRALHGVSKSYGPEEVVMTSSSRQRNESSNHIAPSEIDKNSRQQSKTSIVHKLVHNTTRDNDMVAELPKSITPAMHNGLPEQSGIKTILAKLKPSHNQHLNLRRSTRNSGVHDGESLLSSLDGVPEKEKYSVKHGLGDPWKKPLTYPKVGKKKTTVEWSDLERLDDGEFLNDNLISFYLRYLEQRLEEERPEFARKVYFFNTFFFATLTNAHKGRKRFNYEGVQKWTRSVDLFTYDYIIVPINEQAHWYLAIICNLPALDRDLAMPEDEAPSSVEDDCAVSKQGPSQTEECLSSLTEKPDSNKVEVVNQKTKEPNEKETRDSFSQMSLEHDARLHLGDDPDLRDTEGPQKIHPTFEDKEMLDSQIEDTMPGFAASEEAEDHPLPSKEQGDEIDELVENHDEGPVAVAKSRKSKRKSLPAPITKVDPSKPAIITFDSLGQARGQTIRILKDYLREEAKAKRGMEFEESQLKGINAKRIPQQDNYSDCGVFLLGYVNTFLSLENDPKDFITKTIQQTHEEEDWSRLVPSGLRASIRNQVRELHDIQTNERREESAKKLPKVTGKEDGILVPSPSCASDQAEIVQKEPDKANEAGKVTAMTSKTPEPSSFDSPLTRNGALESARRHEEEEIDKGDDMLEQLLQTNERAMRQGAEYQRLYNSDDVDLDLYDELAPAVQRDDAAIMVDSQSQPRVSAPMGITNSSFFSGKQSSYPESASSRIVDPTSLLFEKEKSPELPSEIPDSQDPNASPKVTKIGDRSALIAPAAKSNITRVSAKLNDISDTTQGLRGLRGEHIARSKGGGIGREDRRDVQEAPVIEDMVFTIEKPSERRQQRKGPSTPRKKSAKESAKDLELVQVHVIDD